MTSRSHHTKFLRTYLTLGTQVRSELMQRIDAAAALHGITRSAWAKRAMQEQLAREETPSLVPEDAILIPTTIAGETP
jgi:hypothetical protein